MNIHFKRNQQDKGNLGQSSFKIVERALSSGGDGGWGDWGTGVLPCSLVTSHVTTTLSHSATPGPCHLAQAVL